MISTQPLMVLLLPFVQLPSLLNMTLNWSDFVARNLHNKMATWWISWAQFYVLKKYFYYSCRTFFPYLQISVCQLLLARYLTVIYCVYLQLSILMKLRLEKSCLIQLIQLLSLHVYLLYYLECTFLFGKGKLEYWGHKPIHTSKKEESEIWILIITS